MAKAKAPRRQMPPMYAEVFRIANELPGELKGMWLLSCWSGLRLSEAAALRPRDVWIPKVDDIRSDRAQAGRIDVLCGKGGKPGRAVLLRHGFGAPAFSQTWREERWDDPLFRNSEYRPWNRKSVNKQFVKVMRRLELPFIYHDSRKFFATYLLNQGVSDLDVAVAMRHVDKHGRPNATLVQKVYGYVDLPAALDRVAQAVA